MPRIRRRRRGTAIVETKKGILVTRDRGKPSFILPGGGARRGETRTEAAIRELQDETGLKPYGVEYLFRHVGKAHKSHEQGSFQDHHTVCLIKAKGKPQPQHEVRRIAYYRPGSGVPISGVTRQIIHKYYRYKKHKQEEREVNKLNKGP